MAFQVGISGLPFRNLIFIHVFNKLYTRKHQSIKLEMYLVSSIFIMFIALHAGQINLKCPDSYTNTNERIQ